jgi:hypothetical protein
VQVPLSKEIAEEIHTIDIIEFFRTKSIDDMEQCRLKIAVSAHIFWLSKWASRNENLQETLK